MRRSFFLLIFKHLCKIKYKLIIFDCDGTLVDSETLTNSVIAQLLTEAGIKTSTEQSFELFAGKSFQDIENHIAQHTGKLPDGQFEKAFRKRCKPLFERELQPVPGIPKLLKHLAKLNLQSCVASNGPQIKMELTLKVTGLDKFFDQTSVFSAYDIQKWKPEPDLFLYAAEKFQVDIDQCLVIEDSVSGIKGALNAKMDVIAYNPHHRKDIKSLQVTEVQRIEEILKIIV